MSGVVDSKTDLRQPFAAMRTAVLHVSDGRLVGDP